MIELKNIDLTGITAEQQIKKMFEEDNELFEAFLKSDVQNSMEEFWDVVQVRLGLLQIILGITADEIMNYYPKHLKKLENRPR